MEMTAFYKAIILETSNSFEVREKALALLTQLHTDGETLTYNDSYSGKESYYLSKNDRDEIIRNFNNDRTRLISCIKMFREKTGAGLKAAKELTERIVGYKYGN